MTAVPPVDPRVVADRAERSAGTAQTDLGGLACAQQDLIADIALVLVDRQ
ncbi:hypothetical protein HYG77_15485 [Rhodococcus sp. ZPP]|nr:hypothetical protein [Rhodococcus sp. ZPP]QTJ66855.1 hypothetical protein HYG77_15485 [Rhodococcus sp. ZPP]